MRQHRIPVRALHAQHQPIFGDARVVHQNLHAAEMSHRRLGSGLDRVFAGDVDGERLCSSASGGNLRRDLSKLASFRAAERDLGSGPCQFNRAGAANALRRSGNKCGFSFERRHQ